MKGMGKMSTEENMMEGEEMEGQEREEAGGEVPAQVLRQIIEEDPELKTQLEGQMKMNRLGRDISMIGAGEFDNLPGWENPIFQKRLAKDIGKFNETNEQGIILVPRQEEVEGRVMAVRPSTVVVFQVDDQVKDNILREVPNYTRPTYFERLWASLEAQGYHPEQASKAYYPTQEEYEQDEETKGPYRRVSQKGYEELRRKQKAREF